MSLSVVVGMGIFVVVGAYMHLIMALEGAVPEEKLYLLLNAMAIGAVVNLIYGYQYVRLEMAKERAGSRNERLTRSAFETPALFLRSEEWIGHPNNEYLHQFVDHAKNAELHQTTGTTHEQFSMLYMYAPATRWAGLLGSINPEAFADFQRRTARRFVQTHLRGGPAPALDADFVRKIR